MTDESGSSGDREVERRLRRHRRSVNEQHGRLAVGRSDVFLPQEQPDVAVRRPLRRPVLDAGDRRILRGRGCCNVRFHAWYSPILVATQTHSTFAPVSRTTLAHRSFSARKKRPNSAGVDPTISMPELAM